MFDYLFLALIILIKVIIYQQLRAVPGQYGLNVLKYGGFNLIAFTLLRMIAALLYYPLLMLFASTDLPEDLFGWIIFGSMGMTFVLCDLLYYRKVEWTRNYNRYVLIILVNLVVSSFVSVISYYGLNYFDWGV